MKNYKYNILKFAFGMIIMTLISCQDEILYNEPIIDGKPVDTSISIKFDVEKSVDVSSRATGGDDGDLIQNINEFWLVAYDKAGDLKLKYQVPIPQADGTLPSTSGYNIINIDDFNIENTSIKYQLNDNRLPGEENLEDDAAGELKFNMTISSGEYFIYGVANVIDFDKMDVSTRDNLKKLTFRWDESDTKQNSQMYGIFSVGQQNREQTDENILKITRHTSKLHAWLRRLASKVTVAFDGSALYDNVEVYIYDITIKDIPQQCSLGYDNHPGWTEVNGKLQEPTTTEQSKNRYIENSNGLIRSGKTIKIQDDFTEEQKKNIRADQYIHVCNSKHKYLGIGDEGNDPQKNDVIHAHESKSLFFFENLQGKGKNKAQVCNPEKPNEISYPNPIENDLTSGWKDHKPYGSYVEVRGFYRNTANNDFVSSGDIIYRFMLGQNESDDYNAVRNTHYKLTLVFKGNGNDADWHIDYKETPGIHITSPQYISYLYNKEMNLTVKISGDKSILKDSYYLRAEIVGCDDSEIKEKHENDPECKFAEQTYWKPWGDGSSDYPSPVGLKDPKNSDIPLYYTGGDNTLDPKINGKPYYGPWWAFLSLRKTRKLQIEVPAGTSGSDYTTMYNSVHGDFNDGNKGWRNYKFEAKDLYEDAEEGNYSVKDIYRSSSNKVERVFTIPLYTRAKELASQSGFTGNNPYYAFPRKQRIKFFIATDENGTPLKDVEPAYVDIIQVRRIVNPKGVWRSGDTPPKDFHVKLKWLQSDDEFNPDTPFDDFDSNGPWSAEIVSGGDNIITLTSTVTGSGSAASQANVRRIEGLSEHPIDFFINFNGNKGCAIVKIRYHNYTCEHDIFCRVGYGPISIGRRNAKWQTVNVYRFSGTGIGKAELCTSPLQEGSLFKNKSTTAILPENNTLATAFTSGDLVVRELNSAEKKTVAWKDIAKNTSLTTENWTIKNSGEYVATYTDYQALMEIGTDAQQTIKKAYGVLYGDGATEPAETIGEAYGYDKTPDDSDITSTKGMRGVFVYDATNCHQIFFPIGKSGMGHRLASGAWRNDDDPGVLRYATRSDYYGFYEADKNLQPYLPLFQDIFRRTGAVYWTRRSNGSTIDNSAFDMNYHTMAFKSYGKDATNHGSVAKDGYLSDACFLRLIEGTAPEEK